MPRFTFWVKVILVGIAAVIGLSILVDWTAEYLWFQALGYESIFWRLRELKVGFFLAGFLPVFAYFWINVWIFGRHVDLSEVAGVLKSQLPRPSGAVDFSGGFVSRVLRLAAAAIALVFGFIFYSQWDTLLRFIWAGSYGQADPVYGHDIGFYLFELPFWELLQDSLLATSFIASILLFLGYQQAGSFHLIWRQGIEARSPIRWHFSANLVLFLVALAWGFYLDRYALLQSTRGAVYGAGYTDVTVVLPAIWTMMGVVLGLAVILLISRFVTKTSVVLLTVAGYLAVHFLVLVMVPLGAQSFLVEPNELKLETPFLRYNIALTRKAYQLDHVDERSYGALSDISPAALDRNRETIDNVRLWDWRPLSVTFQQLQQIRTYYEFGDVDVDRYQLGENTRQVMLAIRELSDVLPGKAETWVNRRLQYTHGYGLAMSLTAVKNEQGGPVLIVKDLPPTSDGVLSVSQPAVYYGEGMSDYQIVSTSVPELDYPKGDENVYTSYRGSGGISLDSFWKRLLFAWHQTDANIVITSYVTANSRFQLWRGVEDRVRRIAPFLRLDKDPYPVLSEGRLYWVQDAYTVSSMFPYSEPYKREFNYIRNSVKVVIDAYEGDAIFYVIDPGDPVLEVYRQSMPALFTLLGDMPEDLRRHLRYPQDLFEAQVAMYSSYHMTVPQVFYNSEDLWAVPREKYGSEVITMKPYYLLMKLPEETDLQFLLMTPLTPANRGNMIAWMAARSDFPDYGALIVYKLPKERLVLGPIQVEAMIDQDTLISQQLSLWDQRGSRVIRGNLLVIPIDQSFLYVEPVYLIAEDSAIPQLKRIIVSDEQRLAMEPTLEEALEVAFGSEPKKPIQTIVEAGTDRLLEARDVLAEAEEALRNGDWNKFGRAMQRLRQLLGEQ